MRNKSIKTFTDAGLDRWIRTIERVVQNSYLRVFEVHIEGCCTAKTGRLYSSTEKNKMTAMATVTYKHDNTCIVSIIAYVGKTRYHYFAEQPYKNLSKRDRKIRKLANYIIRYSKRIAK